MKEDIVDDLKTGFGFSNAIDVEIQVFDDVQDMAMFIQEEENNRLSPHTGSLMTRHHKSSFVASE